MRKLQITMKIEATDYFYDEIWPIVKEKAMALDNDTARIMIMNDDYSTLKLDFMVGGRQDA